jgi:hypothetical protein
MTTVAEETKTAAASWTCAGCGVTTSTAGGAAAPLPETWEESAEGCFCLKCRRDRAAEVAADSAPENDRDARAKLRRSSLIEFELRRAPERPNNIIARACRTSALAISQARKRMDAEEKASAAGEPPA